MRHNIKIEVTVLFFGILPLFAVAVTSPQPPELLLTWRANSYVPSEFSGVVFPTLGSKVDVAITLLDGGRPVPLAKQEVRWFLNNKLMKSEFGLAIMQFSVSAFASNGSLPIKVSLNYRGQLLEQSLAIPVAQPELVLRVPSADDTLRAGSHTLRALPYYWNIANTSALRVVWTANNTPASGEGDPTLISLDIPSAFVGNNLSLVVSATNPANDLESKQTTRRFTILP